MKLTRRKGVMSGWQFPTARDLADVLACYEDTRQAYFVVMLSKDGYFGVRQLGELCQWDYDRLFCAIPIPGGYGLIGPEAAKNWDVVWGIYDAFLRRIDDFLKAAGPRWHIPWLERRCMLDS